MKVFDPASERKKLAGVEGYAIPLGFDFEEFRSEGALASGATGYLNDAVYCLLVGHDDPARQLLKRAFDWVTTAIREQEKAKDYSPDGPEALRYETLAMCNWLLHGIDDAESLKRSVEHSERFLIRERLGRDRTEVSLTAVTYVDARAYQVGLDRLTSAGFSAPKSLASIRSEGQMCYVICQNRLGL